MMPSLYGGVPAAITAIAAITAKVVGTANIDCCNRP